MKSKLSNKFSQADPGKWLVFKSTSHKAIDPIFAGRLAALAQSIGKKINIVAGFRSRAEQEYLYKTCKPGYAAKPGSSWHEFGLAVDVSDQWLKALDKDAATDLQMTLKKFGLYKPLTKGNKTSVNEDWHIQPIECRGVANKAMLAPEMTPILNRNLKLNDIGEDVKMLQERLNKFENKLTCDGYFGKNTEGAVKNFQRIKGLAADGMVGQGTWSKLFE